MRVFGFCVLTLALVGGGQLVHAATITTYSRGTFQGAIGMSGVFSQNFDALTSGTTLTTLNGVTYSASGGNVLVTNTYLTTTPPNGIGSTSVGFFGGTESATFGFSAPITAFAIDVNTFAPTAGDYLATLNIGNVVSSKFDVFPGSATGQFIGFTSDTGFSSVVISSKADPTNQTRYSYTLDTMVYGQASQVIGGVPEPSTWGLLAAGLVAFGFMRRRSRPAKAE